MNQDRLLLLNFKELKLTTKLLKNKKNFFLININKIHILQERIKKCIWKYYNPSEFKHLGILNIINIIKQNCYFNNIKKHI